MTPCDPHYQQMLAAIQPVASAIKVDETSIATTLAALEKQDLTDHSDPMVLAFFVLQRGAMQFGDMNQTCPACALGVNADARIARCAMAATATIQQAVQQVQA